MRVGTVYIMTNRPNGTLYLGVTSNLARRACEHREGLLPGFTKRYGLTRLLWYEHHELVTAAIQRERNMKHWPRAWKVRLILDLNPAWRDLYEELTGEERPLRFPLSVMAGLVPATHAGTPRRCRAGGRSGAAWVAGTSPAMTAERLREQRDAPGEGFVATAAGVSHPRRRTPCDAI